MAHDSASSGGLSSLFECLCDKNGVTDNPVKGIKRPSVEGYQGKTPTIGDHQARGLLEAAKNVSLKGKRGGAILATLLYHALLREEFASFWSRISSMSDAVWSI